MDRNAGDTYPPSFQGEELIVKVYNVHKPCVCVNASTRKNFQHSGCFSFDAVTMAAFVPFATYVQHF